MSWTWDAVCEDPQLQDLPYKVELNGDGELIMNAVKVLHAFLVYEIQRHLMQLGPEGFSPPEFQIKLPMEYDRLMLFGSLPSAESEHSTKVQRVLLLKFAWK